MPWECFVKIPPVNGCGLLVGLKGAGSGTVTCEHGQVFDSLVGCQYKFCIADEPQRSVRLLPALLQQFTQNCLTRRFTLLDTPARKFPGLTVPIEDHEDPARTPEGDERRRQWRVSRRRCLVVPRNASSAGGPGDVAYGAAGGILAGRRLRGREGDHLYLPGHIRVYAGTTGRAALNVGRRDVGYGSTTCCGLAMSREFGPA